jgi:dienelactone hydrolase
MKPTLLALSLATLCGSALAAIEDPGPLAVGWRAVVFEDTIFGQGSISARIYYPAVAAGEEAMPLPESGPYPLIAFQHGWLGAPDNYDDLCTHIAGWGFVVGSTGTETGIFPDVEQFARDTRSLLHWIDTESADSEAWLYQMTADGDWGAAGHSMGGGTLGLLIGIEPRVRTIVGLQSAGPDEQGAENMRAFTGRMAQIAGSRDWIVRPHTVHEWFELAEAAPRNLFYEVQGMGHTGPTDSPSKIEPLPAAEQARLHRRLVTGLFRAEMLGEEDLYAEILGEGLGVEPVERESDCSDPPFWARPSLLEPDCYVAGLGGYAGAHAVIALAPAPGSRQTPYGELGLDPATMQVVLEQNLDTEGWQETLLCPQPGWSAPEVFLQALAAAAPGEGSLSRVIAAELEQ